MIRRGVVLADRITQAPRCQPFGGLDAMADGGNKSDA
jgi:hypothetical protein